jgi:hypothetical protein
MKIRKEMCEKEFYANEVNNLSNINLIYEKVFQLIKNKFPKKIKYDQDCQDVIIKTICSWLQIDKNCYHKWEDIEKLILNLEEIFQLPEFTFVYHTSLFTSLLSTQHILYNMHLDYKCFPFVVSLCESEPGVFKYIIQTEMKMCKYKFDYTKNKTFNLRARNGVKIFVEYEEMKKYALKDEDEVIHEVDKSHKSHQAMKKSKADYGSTNLQRFLHKNQRIVFRTKDNQLFPFSLDLLTTWSKVILMMTDDLETLSDNSDNTSSELIELDIACDSKTFINYIACRLFACDKIKVRKLLDGSEYDYEKIMLENHIELYQFSHYLEDNKFCDKVIYFVNQYEKNMYRLQKFLETQSFLN